MSEDVMKAIFTCKACGADPATLVLPDDYTDDSTASCKDCGVEFGTYGAIKAAAAKQAGEEMKGMFKDAFKGLKGWKIT